MVRGTILLESLGGKSPSNGNRVREINERDASLIGDGNKVWRKDAGDGGQHATTTWVPRLPFVVIGSQDEGVVSISCL